MTRRGNLLAFKPEDDLQSIMKTLVAKPVSYGAVIGEGSQLAGLLYLSDIPRFLEMQQLLDPLDHKTEQSNWPPTPGQADDISGLPTPKSWIKCIMTQIN